MLCTPTNVVTKAVHGWGYFTDNILLLPFRDLIYVTRVKSAGMFTTLHYTPEPLMQTNAENNEKYYVSTRLSMNPAFRALRSYFIDENE